MNLKVLVYLFFISTISYSQYAVGLKKMTDCSQDGYVLFAPLFSKNTYLIDKCGREIHTWKSAYTPAQSVYFLPNGRLLRTGNDTVVNFIHKGGILEILDWNSEILWSYKISDSSQRQHHDVCYMPNGNLLVLVYDRMPASRATKAGRDSSIKSKWIWSEKIVELKPLGKNQAQIIWEWRAWDHLIQEFDENLPNYGKVAENPQRLNINFLASPDEDWLHFNSIDYNPKSDQILISNRNFSEIFIIDHSTTKQQAASHTGGKQNKGGDLIFRWGNPLAYNRGTAADQKLFSQHNARWIKEGLTDAGKIMVFNNGLKRAGEIYSSVEIINPVTDERLNYKLSENHTFLPDGSEWQYGNESLKEFYSTNVSSAQRLSNGNTLICEGENGEFFEINKSGTIVWTYVNPVGHLEILKNGVFPDKNQVFHCFLYEPTYPGFKGRTLTAGKTLEEKPAITDCTLTKKRGLDCDTN